MMQKSIQRYSYDCRARTDCRLFGNLGVLISNRTEVFRKVNLLYYGMTTEGEMERWRYSLIQHPKTYIMDTNMSKGEKEKRRGESVKIS